MKITKLGHCALVLEDKGVKILTDPGSYTIEAQENVTGLDAILITHEHQDHLHVGSVSTLLGTNPGAKVISNAAVASILKKHGIDCLVVGDGQLATIDTMTIEGFGKDHAPIYETMGLVENTGYLVNGTFYFPGDNFHVPAHAGKSRKVDVLALPIAGPWMKPAEAIDYAKEMKARAAFGVHDGMLIPTSRGFIYMLLRMFVKGTEFVELKDGESHDFS